MNGNPECLVVGVFTSPAQFSNALEKLVGAGFAQADISILGNHQDILDHFGNIPGIDDLADRPDTPRDTLEGHATMRGVIDFLADSLAVVAEIGSAAAAFAVGGPIGVATGTSAKAEESLGGFLTEIADDHWQNRLEQSARDGGIICWVRAPDAELAQQAEAMLKEAGGDHIHRTRPLPDTVWPID